MVHINPNNPVVKFRSQLECVNKYHSVIISVISDLWGFPVYDTARDYKPLGEKSLCLNI